MLNLPTTMRMIISTIMITCPLAFAAVLFARAFRDVQQPHIALGSNILGAVVGGILEYSCLLIGMKSIYILVFLIYTLAYMTMSSSSRS
jgi:hypothetical protein